MIKKSSNEYKWLPEHQRGCGGRSGLSALAILAPSGWLCHSAEAGLMKTDDEVLQQSRAFS